MNKMKQVTIVKIGLVFCVVLAGTLTGCVGYVDGPRGGGAYVEPQPVYVQPEVVVQPAYVYYPSYEVYYSSNTRQYVYRDGHSWVTRGAPPHVSAQVLFASPSVRLGFHDSPSFHHAEIVKQYPKHWAPPAASYGPNEGRNERNY